MSLKNKAARSVGATNILSAFCPLFLTAIRSGVILFGFVFNFNIGIQLNFSSGSTLHTIPMQLPLKYLIFSLTLFTSCFHDFYKPLQQVNFTITEKYEIKSISGCCGCEALYYNVYHNKILTEQFIVELRCALYKPTKSIFSYDTNGNITSFKSLVAVFDSSYKYELTDVDRAAFIRLDSIYATWSGPTLREIIFKSITGFREESGTHPPREIKMPKSR